MPELPEVETVVRSLRPVLVGRTIRGVQRKRLKLRQPWKREWDRELFDRKIVEVWRRGKWILLELSGGEARLVVHLGMTGRLYVQESKSAPARHTHFSFSLDDGQEQLRYLDPRRFGLVLWAKTVNDCRFPAECELGPEPFDLQPARFFESLRGSRRNLKALLLDQTVVAGVGNIYADEALFAARLNPMSLGTELDKKQAGRLRIAIVKVLKRAIETKGSTIANFYYGEGEAGGYQNEFRAYDRTDEPCRRCRTPIKRIRLAGRSTHFCPRCQR